MPETPIRVQRRRTKGYRLPPNTVSVTRPGRWGNPFKGEDGASTGGRQTLVDHYREWLTTPCRPGRDPGVLERRAAIIPVTSLHGVPFASRPSLDEIRRHLRGKNLACFCPIGQPCHADVLLELANTPMPPADDA